MPGCGRPRRRRDRGAPPRRPPSHALLRARRPCPSHDRARHRLRPGGGRAPRRPARPRRTRPRRPRPAKAATRTPALRRAPRSRPRRPRRRSAASSIAAPRTTIRPLARSTWTSVDALEGLDLLHHRRPAMAAGHALDLIGPLGLGHRVSSSYWEEYSASRVAYSPGVCQVAA